MIVMLNHLRMFGVKRKQRDTGTWRHFANVANATSEWLDNTLAVASWFVTAVPFFHGSLFVFHLHKNELTQLSFR